MYYFLFVCLDFFYTAGSEASVVHHNGRVLDSCAAARARRVVPGTSLAEAKTILRADARYVEYREEHYRERRDQWLDACLLYSSLIEHESPASAWIDLTRHPDPVDIAARLLKDVWHSNGLPLRAALAPMKWISKLAARTCDPTALSLGVPDFPVVLDAAEFLRTLPTRMLVPVALEHRQRLEFLGYRRIADVQRAPLHLLTGQFGRDGLVILQTANARLGDPVRPNYPRLTIESLRVFEGCCSDRHALVSAVSEVAQELEDALRRHDMLAGTTETVLELETGLWLRRTRKLSRPSVALSLPLVHTIEHTPITAPVASLRVSVPDPKPVRIVQRSLVDQAARRDQKAALASVHELQSAYGTTVVRPAADIEPSRREKVLRAWRDANGWR